MYKGLYEQKIQLETTSSVVYGQITEEERIEYIDERINELGRDFANCSIANKRKNYERIKYLFDYKSEITGHLFVNPHTYRIMYDFENIHIGKNIIKRFNESLERSIADFENVTDIKIKEYTHLLKLLMLKILYGLNVYYHNDKFEFIFKKNKMKKLNGKMNDEFKLFEKNI